VKAHVLLGVGKHPVLAAFVVPFQNCAAQERQFL
jgi:hypothetical protein